ncbi:MAG: HD domain-containing protein [Pyrinomonadaceae bacterium]
MAKRKRPSTEEVSRAIGEFLEKHPEVAGIKGLSEKVNLSYDSLQKYAKGANAPPSEKWERLCSAIGYSPSENYPTRPGLFYSTWENSRMTPEKSDPTNVQPSADVNPADSPATTEENSTAEEPVSVQADDGSQDLLDLMSDGPTWSRTEDRQETFLPASGFTWFFPEEMEIIDHAAFQRLAGMHQLGMTNLVYRGATHRRIEHALGAVGIAQRMLEATTHNCLKRSSSPVDPKDQWHLGHPPTAIEKRFIRLGTLLHDIGHVPYGHTIEDELRLLNKHDGPERVEKIFNSDTWHGEKTDTLGQVIDEHYKQFMPNALVAESYRPSDVVKLIILKPSKNATEEEKNDDRRAQEICAGAGLRISICRDMVGNTICADLLDYLHRDWYHLGKPRYFDERILHYMEIRTPESNKSISKNGHPDPTAKDVFVIMIGNRPKLRTDGISAILSLLESRYELAEAVLFHRTKMNATAMLERALTLCVPQSTLEKSPSNQTTKSSKNVNEKETDREVDPESMKQTLEKWLIENPEEVLLPALLKGEGPVKASDVKGTTKSDWQRGRVLVSKLLRRDLYKSLLIVTYDEFEGRDVRSIQMMYGDGYKNLDDHGNAGEEKIAIEKNPALNRAKALRLLESDFNLEVGSILMYCPDSRMNKKIAEVKLFVENIVERFDEFERANKNALSAGHLKAQLDRFTTLWKIAFFVAPEVRAEHGDDFIRELRYAVRTFVLKLYPRGESVETESARIARSVVNMPTFHKFRATALAAPPSLQFARTDPRVVTKLYPTGARRLLDYIADDGSNKDSGDTEKGTTRA